MLGNEALPVLEVDGLRCGYGSRQILFDVSLSLLAGQVVALIGVNGVGKSTLLKVVAGLLPQWSGSVTVFGSRVRSQDPLAPVHLGLALVPQGNRVFPHLTVRENLELGAWTLSRRDGNQECVRKVLEAFPVLAKRQKQLARTLSGGERQSLALASALVRRPAVLLLDEPSHGLAPEATRATLRLIRDLADSGQVGVLVVEHKIREILSISDRVYALRSGRVSFSGSATQLLHDESLLREALLM